MNNLKYFIQFLVIILLLIIFRIIGIKYSTILSGKIFEILGPLIRSNKISQLNLSKAFPKLTELEKTKIIINSTMTIQYLPFTIHCLLFTIHYLLLLLL